jgi:hypothetical protein
LRRGKIAESEGAGKALAEYGDLLHPQGPARKGPGFTDVAQTDRGTRLPPVAAQAPLPKSPAELKPAIEAWQKTTNDWNASLAPGYQAEQRLNSIAKAFKTFESGSFATERGNVAAALKSAGLDNLSQLVLKGDPAQVQLALHENYLETIQQLKAASQRWTQMEFKAISANREHPNIQPAANLQMLSEDIGTLRQGRDLTNDFNLGRRNGWRDPHSFQAEWLKENPLSEYVDRTKKEIGPLKGMEGARTKGAQSAIPSTAIDHLRVNPQLAPHFDEMFGQRAAARILGGR